MSEAVDTKKLPAGPISWMAQHPVAANLLMIILVVGGLIIAGQVKQEVFPEFSTDIVQVSVPYPGASPEEVEQGIVLSIEDEVRGLDGIKTVRSTASEGSASIIIELLTSADKGKALQDVKNAVDKIQSFPEEAERPVVSLIESRRRVISIILSGNQEESALRELAEQVRDELLQQPGITLIELGAIRPLEIAVEIPQDTLRAYGITLNEVAQRIRESALELPGGNVRTSQGQILLRTQERRDYASEFFDIPIASSSDGSLLRLGQVAQIQESFEETDEEAFFNGKPAVRVDVYRVGSETPQSVSGQVKNYAIKLQERVPLDVDVRTWDDSSEKYTDRMNLLIKNAMLGLILVLLLLGLFLEPRLAIWVTVGIPISILGSFLFIPVTGASINMISLFAFIVSLGIVVDDAVVMGENIYEKREKGMPALQAAIMGAREISGPIVFAVLTNVVAFMPLLFVPGVSGKFFMQIPSVVIFVFLVSLVEALFILPAHLSHSPKDRWFWRILSYPREHCEKWLHSFIHDRYKPTIATAVRQRGRTVALALAGLMLALGLVFGGHIRFTFLPKIDSDVVTAQATLPFGAPMAESRKIRERIVAAAESLIEENGGDEVVEGIYALIGRQLVSFGPGPSLAGGRGSHIVAVQLQLVGSDDRDFSSVEFKEWWKRELGDVVGLETLMFKAETGASEGAPIDIQLSHRNRETLETAATELGQILSGYAGTSDIDDGVSQGKAQLSLKLKEQARTLGLSTADMARQVRAAFYGAEALRQQRGRNEVKVMVRLPEEERASLSTVEDLMLRTPEGGEIPLYEAAEVIEGRSYTRISRRDGRRIIAVTADVDSEQSNANKIVDQIIAEDMPLLQRKYPGLSFGFGGEQEAQRDSLSSLGIGFLIALLAIYALLAIPCRSYLQPMIVMLSIPFGIIGAIGGHYLLGYGLSIISMFGIIALTGVVVNDSLVLVVTANRLRRQEGLSALEAITLAGARRFRPIILTSLTTFFGLAPMIFESSVQARFLIPMAISLGFGILFATVIILIIVPAVYLLIEDLSEVLQRLSKDSAEGSQKAGISTQIP